MFVVMKKMLHYDWYYLGKAGQSNEWTLNRGEAKKFGDKDDARECILGDMGYEESVINKSIFIV